jgi:hypothetical protein
MFWGVKEVIDSTRADDRLKELFEHIDNFFRVEGQVGNHFLVNVL